MEGTKYAIPEVGLPAIVMALSPAVAVAKSMVVDDNFTVEN